jgi:L-ascorbate metabolism protein UlaG (beta-lactamase superfamily)
MEFTYYGHACFGVTIHEKHILFDPFITPNELAKNININAIQADYIFLSHGHGDHVADVAAIAKRTGATIVANFEVIEWVNAQGLAKAHPMNHGGQWQFDFGKVKYVNAVHSGKLPDGSNGGNPGGFVFKTSAGNFYYAGDTALTMDMQLIPRFAQLDFAVLPIGDNFTMGYEDALIAAEFIQCKKIIGVHYDTFGYIKIDKPKAQEAFSKAGYTLLLPGIGETIQV